MTYTNVQMENMAGSLQKHLDRVDLIGYAAARNTRILRDELREYFGKREELVLKHGKPEVDEEGCETGKVVVPFDSPEFTAFLKELDPFAAIEHEPNLMKLKYGQAIGQLSGKELLELDWMFED